MWAAFMALTNELSLKKGGFNLGFINPFLYQIDQSANGTSYGSDFHDITNGNNIVYGGSVYPATASYDMASGLGSYNGWNLGQDLVKLALAQNGSRGAPAKTKWYFAEGSVGGSFQEYLTILNPVSQTANVTIQYLFEHQSPVTKIYGVAASTRFTVNANEDLGIPTSAPQQAISAIVTSDPPIVAERPMYFDWYNIRSGTDVVGATDATRTTFYFAQGDTTQNSNSNSSEFLTMLNPSATATATVTATYYSN